MPVDMGVDVDGAGAMFVILLLVVFLIGVICDVVSE